MMIAVPALALFWLLSFWVHWRRRTPVASVGLSRAAVVNDRELWRPLSAASAHYDGVHVLCTAALLLGTAELETVWGSFVYIGQSCIIFVRCCKRGVGVGGVGVGGW